MLPPFLSVSDPIPLSSSSKRRNSPPLPSPSTRRNSPPARALAPDPPTPGHQRSPPQPPRCQRPQPASLPLLPAPPGRAAPPNPSRPLAPPLRPSTHRDPPLRPSTHRAPPLWLSPRTLRKSCGDCLAWLLRSAEELKKSKPSRPPQPRPRAASELRRPPPASDTPSRPAATRRCRYAFPPRFGALRVGESAGSGTPAMQNQSWSFQCSQRGEKRRPIRVQICVWMEMRMSSSQPGAHFPVPHRSISLDIKGNKTDIVISKYEDSFMVIVTQIGCMGTILAAKKDESVFADPTYNVSVVFGKRDEPLLLACGRQLIEHISGSGSALSLVISLGLKDHSQGTLKDIISAVIENRLW